MSKKFLLNNISNNSTLYRNFKLKDGEDRRRHFDCWANDNQYRLEQGSWAYLYNGTIPKTTAKENNAEIKKLKNLAFSNYKRFINIIKADTERRLNGSYLTTFVDDYLIVLKNELDVASDSNNDDLLFHVLCVYNPENEKILNLLKEMLRYSDNHPWTRLFLSYENNYNFICPWQILKAILANASLDETKGEVSFRKMMIKDGKRKKMREIVIPHDKIRESLRDVNKVLQSTYDKRNLNIQIGSKKGKSVKDGAQAHINHKFVYNLDIHHFYQSCKKEAVEKYVNFLLLPSFNRKVVSREFYNLILSDGALFLGSPISGTLANAIISGAVKYMSIIAEKYNMTMTVYVDDITFSSDKFISKDFVVSIVNSAFERYGLNEMFTLSEDKLIGLSGCNRKVTGVSINGDDKVTVPRKYYRDLYYSLKSVQLGNPNTDIQKLRGKIAYALMIDESGKIKRLLNLFKAEVIKHHLASSDKLN